MHTSKNNWNSFFSEPSPEHTWRRVHKPIFYEDPPEWPTPTHTHTHTHTHFFQVLPNNLLPFTCNFQPRCSFCWLVSLVKWIIAPCLMSYFTWWYYESKHLEPYFLSSNRRTLLCVLCKKVSSLLKFDTYCRFLQALWFDITHTHHIHKQRQLYTQGLIDTPI